MGWVDGDPRHPYSHGAVEVTVAEPPVFIVGTGRCGSTLLSDIVRIHPEWLSLSELFVGIAPDCFATDQLSGAAFWAQLTTPQCATSTLLRFRLEPSEFLYPVDRPDSRYSRDVGVPPIATVCLPHLVDRPDDLLDELAAVIAPRPVGAVADHFLVLFDVLRNRFGKRLVVERSGASLSFVSQLIRQFTEARFVHVYRRGDTTARSMQRHAAFRIMFLRADLRRALGHDPYTRELAEDATRLGDPLRSLLPSHFAPDTFRDHEIREASFGAYWSLATVRGLRALRTLPKDRVLHLSYDQIVAEPDPAIRALQQFLGAAGDSDASWPAAARRLIRPRQPETSTPSPQLARACRPGTEALKALGLSP